jgi:hypothetical protein
MILKPPESYSICFTTFTDAIMYAEVRDGRFIIVTGCGEILNCDPQIMIKNTTFYDSLAHNDKDVVKYLKNPELLNPVPFNLWASLIK